ncbi:MAG: DUF1566 domain-containing protein [Desulfovibrionales bacterium]
MPSSFLQTGLFLCYDEKGVPLSCAGSGQDGEYLSGVQWPEHRFQADGKGRVTDLLTGLMWPQSANLFEFPVTWDEALAAIKTANRENLLGYEDWRLPNRRELRSLISHGAKKPALPVDHPFTNVYLTWYWTSTSAAIAPGYAWYVHMEGGRMFYGKKDGYSLLWPVRGETAVLPATGQRQCFAVSGHPVECPGTGQDGEVQSGLPWPSPRFERHSRGVRDCLTGLIWHPDADFSQKLLTWEEALAEIHALNDQGASTWRLPNINELESLVDASTHSPALPVDHPFMNPRDGYWSSTTSFFEPDWSYVLYLTKGAVGVGHKAGREFFAWPVSGP